MFTLTKDRGGMLSLDMIYITKNSAYKLRFMYVVYNQTHLGAAVAVNANIGTSGRLFLKDDSLR